VASELFEAHAAMSADPEVMRYLGGVGHWALRGYRNWAIDTGER
jgi:hypothetical protein